MFPYAIEREPQELLPAIPPMVACAAVDTSTGNHRLDAFNLALSRSRTMPGSTIARWLAGSNSTIAFRYLLLSITSASPTVCPHCEVPAPRGSMATPCSAAICNALIAASRVRGTTTPIGMIW